MVGSISLSRQIRRAAVTLFLALVAVLCGFGWWAASRIDDLSIARETRSLSIGLNEVMDSLPLEQDSSAIWDDAVINLRAGNGEWVADNLAEWMSEYYGHDRIYILGPDNELVRAVEKGETAPLAVFKADQAAIMPLVAELRRQMAKAAQGLPDSTPAITGMGVLDLSPFEEDLIGIVSARPVLPASENVQQAPGSEFIHVSVKLIGPEVAARIGAKFGIEDLRLERAAPSDIDRAAMPIYNNLGHTIGHFTWIPYEPAYALISETLPVLVGALLIAGLGVVVLIKRLDRTSTMLEQSEAQATFLAFHDPLTGIPNRALFEDRLSQAAANAGLGGPRAALHCIDLDHFKQVNDSLGHPVGDELLRQVAARLRKLVTDADTVARMGGDEFAIIQFSVRDSHEAMSLAQAVVRELARPFDLAGHAVEISASVGVVLFDGHEISGEELLRQADLALYEAKSGGRNRCLLYGGELGETVRERRALELDLRKALEEDGGLFLVYQPIFDAATNRIAGAEALIRWKHPQRGMLSPLEFISLAEERGLIDALGLWALRRACVDAAGSDLPWVAVNVSPLQFRDEALADKVFATLAETGLHPRRLELEITEGLLLQSSPTVQQTLLRLRASGIRVALDDFGTGYSSISYLRTHSVDKLKIDQSFTAKLGRDGQIDTIVHSIIELGHAMHMTVTAEGVETEHECAILQRLGCNQLQGYLLARPLPCGDLLRLLAASAPSADETEGEVGRKSSGTAA